MKKLLIAGVCDIVLILITLVLIYFEDGKMVYGLAALDSMGRFVMYLWALIFECVILGILAIAAIVVLIIKKKAS